LPRDLEEQFYTNLGERHETKFVDYEQLLAGQQQSVDRSIGPYPLFRPDLIRTTNHNMRLEPLQPGANLELKGLFPGANPEINLP
jgi:hypothetical protein